MLVQKKIISGQNFHNVLHQDHVKCVTIHLEIRNMQCLLDYLEVPQAEAMV